MKLRNADRQLLGMFPNQISGTSAPAPGSQRHDPAADLTRANGIANVLFHWRFCVSPGLSPELSRYFLAHAQALAHSFGVEGINPKTKRKNEK